MKGQQDEERRPNPVLVDKPGLVGYEKDLRNRAMVARIAFNYSLLLLLAVFDPSRDHGRALERLLILCSMVTCFVALLTRERWSLSDINRWDEALIFTTVALGLRTFA